LTLATRDGSAPVGQRDVRRSAEVTSVSISKKIKRVNEREKIRGRKGTHHGKG